MVGTLGVTSTSLAFAALIADDSYGPVRLSQTILSGQNLSAGTIVARQTSSGKFLAYDADGTDDGRRTPVGVMLEDVNASSGDTEGIVGFAGVYVEDNMTGLDDAGKLALEAKGVYFKSL
ncbi:MAG: head decoration protein [Candidatus Riflebacteria bacterium]|nr:head decoration protein [Candidatus Riflebacteria bacterium]